MCTLNVANVSDNDVGLFDSFSVQSLHLTISVCLFVKPLHTDLIWEEPVLYLNITDKSAKNQFSLAFLGSLLLPACHKNTSFGLISLTESMRSAKDSSSTGIK